MSIQVILRKFHGQGGRIGYVYTVYGDWDGDAEVYAEKLLDGADVGMVEQETKDTLSYLLAYAAFVFYGQIKNHCPNPDKNPTNQRQDRLIVLAEQLAESSTNTTLHGYIKYVQSGLYTLASNQNLVEAEAAAQEAIRCFHHDSCHSNYLLAHAYYALGSIHYFHRPKEQGVAAAKRHFKMAYECLQQVEPDVHFVGINAGFLCAKQDVRTLILKVLNTIDNHEHDYITQLIGGMIPGEHRRKTISSFYYVDACTIETIVEGLKASRRYEAMMGVKPGTYCAWGQDALLLSRAVLPYYTPPLVGGPAILNTEQQKTLVYLLAHAAWIIVHQNRPAYVTSLKEAVDLIEKANEVVSCNKLLDNALQGYVMYVKSLVYATDSEQYNIAASESAARGAVHFFKAMDHALLIAYGEYQLGCVLLKQHDTSESAEYFKDAGDRLKVETKPVVPDAQSNQFEINAENLVFSVESKDMGLEARIQSSVAASELEHQNKRLKLDSSV